MIVIVVVPMLSLYVSAIISYGLSGVAVPSSTAFIVQASGTWTEAGTDSVAAEDPAEERAKREVTVAVIRTAKGKIIKSFALALLFFMLSLLPTVEII